MQQTLEILVEQAKGGNKNALESLIERIQDRGLGSRNFDLVIEAEG